MIDGERVRLRDFRAKDLGPYERWMQPGARWQEFDAPYFGAPDPTWVRDHVEGLQERIESGAWEDPRRRVVLARRDDDELIGTLARYWICEATEWPGVGIDIYDPDAWGRGYGSEALTLWCDYLFAQGYHRLDMRTWSGNERMMRLAEKLGFRLEARFREARPVDGKRYDGLAYGLLRAEWCGIDSAPPRP